MFAVASYNCYRCLLVYVNIGNTKVALGLELESGVHWPNRFFFLSGGACSCFTSVPNSHAFQYYIAISTL